ncbi:unnamed protein product [Haemonchus placei]|uniref:Uncharacterized protein n=1 Tax=Haemonchus placei TaxID=6290 RepID=A0A0N4WJF3_HAEPC|nr:unnamed protein product [Haemonchus placei]
MVLSQSSVVVLALEEMTIVNDKVCLYFGPIRRTLTDSGEWGSDTYPATVTGDITLHGWMNTKDGKARGREKEEEEEKEKEKENEKEKEREKD